MASILFALAGCESDEATSDFPTPKRYGEFDRAPRVLLSQPAAEVVDYLKSFKILHDSGEGGSALAPRTIRIRDQDRTITVELKSGICDEIRIAGRHGDSVWPKIPDDFETIRDSYAGKLDWAPVTDKSEVKPVKLIGAEGKGTTKNLVIGGERSWESFNGSALAEVSWRFDNPGDPVRGNYHVTLKKVTL